MGKKVSAKVAKSTREIVFDFILTYKEAHNGDSPSNREIATGCHLGLSTVNYHLLKLESEGRIQIVGRRRIHIVGGTWARPSKGAEAEENANHVDGDEDLSDDNLSDYNIDRKKDNDLRPVQKKEASRGTSAEDSSTPPYS